MNNKLSFLDFITLISFGVGAYALYIALQNLEENRLQTNDTQKILDDLENHLKMQDEHLHNQDLHLIEQDKLLERSLQ